MMWGYMLGGGHEQLMKQRLLGLEADENGLCCHFTGSFPDPRPTNKTMPRLFLREPK